MLEVLLIEDESSYAVAVEAALGQEGMAVSSVVDGRSGLARFRESRPDVVLLDLMLPGMPGLDVLRNIRRDSDVPVIVLSAKDREADVVTALELGADDYLTKPYSLRELTARIRAAIRRNHPADQEQAVLAVGNAVLDPTRYELRLGESVFTLPRKEFEVMHLLATNAGRIVSRADLFEQIWGYRFDGSKSLDQHIRRLRRKLETVESAPVIQTVRGVGYRLDAASDES